MQASGFHLQCCLLLTIVMKEIVGASTGRSARAEAWEPNYCNSTLLQEEAGLRKTALGQFLGYDCDSTFFHCRWGIAGWRTYKKKCGIGLIYDTSGTQNCNYDFNVQGCNTHNSCADCLDNQYSCCLSEECVELGQRCDGNYDCSLEEDEQNCPTCSADEFPCVLTDKCIPISQRCNGANDCGGGGAGSDEENCAECDNGFFFCANSNKCVEAELRCDGKRDCSKGEDEAFCHSTEEKPYLCRNQVDRIPLDQLCDGVSQCPDGTDEAYCDNGKGYNYAGGTLDSTAQATPKPDEYDDDYTYDDE